MTETEMREKVIGHALRLRSEASAVCIAARALLHFERGEATEPLVYDSKEGALDGLSVFVATLESAQRSLVDDYNNDWQTWHPK